MKRSLFASTALATLGAAADWREVSCCPYCPNEKTRHWIRWGFYPRWAEGKSERIRIQRYRCKVTGRTFSLLPDALLPYHYFTTSHVLRLLHALFVEAVAVTVLAQREAIPRGTLRHLRRAFSRTSPILRLAGRETAAEPVEFLRILARMAAAAIVLLFAGWKELEPKHCVLGIYRR